MPMHAQLQTRIAESEARVLELQADLQAKPQPPKYPSQLPATLAELKALAEERDRALAEQEQKQQQLVKLQSRVDELETTQRQLEADKTQRSLTDHLSQELGQVQGTLRELRAELVRKQHQLEAANRTLRHEAASSPSSSGKADARLADMRSELAAAHVVTAPLTQAAQRAAQREGEVERRLGEAEDLSTSLTASWQP